MPVLQGCFWLLPRPGLLLAAAKTDSSSAAESLRVTTQDQELHRSLTPSESNHLHEGNASSAMLNTPWTEKLSQRKEFGQNTWWNNTNSKERQTLQTNTLRETYGRDTIWLLKTALSKTLQLQGWGVQQVSFIARARSLNEESLWENLETFNVPDRHRIHTIEADNENSRRICQHPQGHVQRKIQSSYLQQGWFESSSNDPPGHTHKLLSEPLTP